ncbi:PaaI family thioesterase [uncultured Ferrimonas sp.]|uniref:PaaI family thioesterase n=1 Tax=uncultured Ferrimonas sp. TaxID=432640 RepID=UPI00261AD502|nr:PaaI family thioesterase [uncultured Ferrimonas sp.]
MFDPRDPHYQQKVRASFGKQTLMATLDASLHSIEPGQVEIHAPYNAAFTQQHGFLHAGIVSSLIDSACGYAAFSLMPADAEVLSIEFKVNLLAPAKGQRFIAIGKVKKPGRTITVTEGELYAINGEQQKLVATLTATMMTIIGRDDIKE